MKNTCQILSLIVLVASQGFAQFTIGSGVDVSTNNGTTISANGDISLGSKDRTFEQSAWYLVGRDQQITSSSNLTTFFQLYIEGGGAKTFTGNFGIVNALHLNDGIVVTPSDDSQNFVLSSPGVIQLEGGSNQSYVEGMLFINIGDKNNAMYPVGNGGTYTPIELTSISGSSPIIGIDANSRNVEEEADASTVVLPSQVDDFSENWNWELELFTSAGALSQAKITIPLLQDDKDQFSGEDYKPVVLYQNRAGVTSNLDNASGDAASSGDAFIVADDLSGEGRYFAGKTLVNPIVVHNIITPNGDNINDYLVIDNLELFPENEIVIVDRYGVEIYTKSNYVSPDADSADGEDFTFLPPGNYICILRYNNGANTVKQTISVIK